MKSLVTGSTGFIGSHLCSYLQKKGLEVYGTTHKMSGALPGVNFINTNLLIKKQVENLLENIKPTYIFHLAAQSLVLPSWENPSKTFEFNIFSTLFLIESVMKLKLKTKIIVFGSSSEYAPSENKIKENFYLEPSSPYALSKLVQDNLANLYYKAYGIDTIRVRPFFIIGPGKQHDVTADFCQRIVAIEKGKMNHITTGNLNSERDFLDIDDALSAIWLITENGKKGDSYNICSGTGVQVNKVLKKLISYSHKPIKVTVDKKHFRPIDEARKVGDNSKLKSLGWKQKVTLDESLLKTLNYWRKFS